jgi:hypothetical protein
MSAKRSRLAIATWRRSIAAAARVPSLETASDVGLDARGSGIEASTANVAESMTSIAPRRAAYNRSPSALTASAPGVPRRPAAPTGRRVARSIPSTRVPAATYPREPSGAAATARLRPPTGIRATTWFVATSVSVAAPSPVATSTTRAEAAAGASRATAIRAGRSLANRRIDPVTQGRPRRLRRRTGYW